MSHTYSRLVRFIISFFLALLSAAFLSVSGQENGEDELMRLLSFSDYDDSGLEKPVKMTLALDIKKLLREKNKSEYQEAVLGWYDAEGEKFSRQVRVRARGKFRKRYCRFIPVRISFSTGADSSKAILPAMKMVTHCKHVKAFEAYVLKEYLAYRIYNLITDVSYRVKLVEMEYTDSRGKMKPFSRYAFFIESPAQMEKRLGCSFLDNEVPCTIYQTDYESINRMTLFQFMIGNTDWNVKIKQNLDLVNTRDSVAFRPVPVPYDFDYCGLVNAIYAVPYEKLPIKSVRERYYLGLCIHEPEFYRFFDYFSGKKEAFYHLVENFGILEEKERQYVLKYLDEFYAIINDRRRAQDMIIQQCID